MIINGPHLIEALKEKQWKAALLKISTDLEIDPIVIVNNHFVFKCEDSQAVPCEIALFNLMESINDEQIQILINDPIEVTLIMKNGKQYSAAYKVNFTEEEEEKK